MILSLISLVFPREHSRRRRTEARAQRGGHVATRRAQGYTLARAAQRGGHGATRRAQGSTLARAAQRNEARRGPVRKNAPESITARFVGAIGAQVGVLESDGGSA